MPISSGAEGHVGIGVDKSIKWVPEGGEDYQALRISNSYLQRYLNQYGAEEKIKKGEIIKSMGHQIIPNTANRENRKEGSDMNLTEQRRHEPSTVQARTIKETNSTIYTQENSRKTGKEDSHKGANNTDMTTRQQPQNNAMSSTNGQSKKSRVCVIF